MDSKRELPLSISSKQTSFFHKNVLTKQPKKSHEQKALIFQQIKEVFKIIFPFVGISPIRLKGPDYKDECDRLALRLSFEKNLASRKEILNFLIKRNDETGLKIALNFITDEERNFFYLKTIRLACQNNADLVREHASLLVEFIKTEESNEIRAEILQKIQDIFNTHSGLKLFLLSEVICPLITEKILSIEEIRKFLPLLRKAMSDINHKVDAAARNILLQIRKAKSIPVDELVFLGKEEKVILPDKKQLAARLEIIFNREAHVYIRKYEIERLAQNVPMFYLTEILERTNQYVAHCEKLPTVCHCPKEVTRPLFQFLASIYLCGSRESQKNIQDLFIDAASSSHRDAAVASYHLVLNELPLNDKNNFFKRLVSGLCLDICSDITKPQKFYLLPPYIPDVADVLAFYLKYLRNEYKKLIKKETLDAVIPLPLDVIEIVAKYAFK